MLKHRLVQALLLAVPATVALSGSVSFVQAAEECRAKPGPTAPSGSRWLYRINRTDHRHCWFLSSKAVSTHSQLSRRYRHLAGEPDAVRQDQQGGSDLKARSAPASETDVAEAAEPPTAPQVAAPSVESIVGKSCCAQRSDHCLQAATTQRANGLAANGRCCTHCRAAAGGREQNQCGSSCWRSGFRTSFCCRSFSRHTPCPPAITDARYRRSARRKRASRC